MNHQEAELAHIRYHPREAPEGRLWRAAALKAEGDQCAFKPITAASVTEERGLTWLKEQGAASVFKSPFDNRSIHADDLIQLIAPPPHNGIRDVNLLAAYYELLCDYANLRCMDGRIRWHPSRFNSPAQAAFRYPYYWAAPYEFAYYVLLNERKGRLRNEVRTPLEYGAAYMRSKHIGGKTLLRLQCFFIDLTLRLSRYRGNPPHATLICISGIDHTIDFYDSLNSGDETEALRNLLLFLSHTLGEHFYPGYWRLRTRHSSRQDPTTRDCGVFCAIHATSLSLGYSISQLNAGKLKAKRHRMVHEFLNNGLGRNAPEFNYPFVHLRPPPNDDDRNRNFFPLLSPDYRRYWDALEPRVRNRQPRFAYARTKAALSRYCVYQNQVGVAPPNRFASPPRGRLGGYTAARRGELADFRVWIEAKEAANRSAGYRPIWYPWRMERNNLGLDIPLPEDPADLPN